MQARVAAIDELVELGVLEGPGGQLPRGMMLELPDPDRSEAVEHQLAEFKQQLGLG